MDNKIYNTLDQMYSNVTVAIPFQKIWLFTDRQTGKVLFQLITENWPECELDRLRKHCENIKRSFLSE